MVLSTLAASLSRPYLALGGAALSLVAGAFLLDLVRRLRAAENCRSVGSFDAETGLPHLNLEDALETRLAIARRQLWPLSVVYLEFRPHPSELEGRALTLGGLASVVRVSLRSSDTALRVGEDRLVLILDDTNEQGAVWTVERLQESIDSQLGPVLHLIAGIASYPTHGLSTKEILIAAERALERALLQASSSGGDPVEVAPSE